MAGWSWALCDLESFQQVPIVVPILYVTRTNRRTLLPSHPAEPGARSSGAAQAG